MTRMRVALVNPPAEAPVLRDYYCSTRPKARYHWHPIDILALAARLQDQAELLVVDAIAESLSEVAFRKRVAAFAPDSIVGLVSTLTKGTDLRVLSSLCGPDIRLSISGEVALDKSFDFARWSAVDGLLLDFTSPEAADFVLGKEAAGRVHTPEHQPTEPPQSTEFTLGPMPHERLPARGYKMPLWGGAFRSLLTDFGCPFTCTFCNSGRHAIGYKRRAIDDVAADIAWMSALGTQRVYLRDMTFGARREHTLEVLSMLAPHQWSLRGFMRADLIDDELASALSDSGFELAQIGIEVPKQGRRSALGKKLLDSKLLDGVSHLRRHQVAFGAHFVLGFEGDEVDAVLDCANLAEQLGAAYLSINIYAHRLGCEHQTPVDDARRAKIERRAWQVMWRYNGPRLVKTAVGHLLA